MTQYIIELTITLHVTFTHASFPCYEVIYNFYRLSKHASRRYVMILASHVHLRKYNNFHHQ